MSKELMACAMCGYRLVRKSVEQRFCSERCRDYADQSPPQPATVTKPPPYPACLSTNFPFEILGHGYRPPDVKAPDRDLLAKIIRAEIGGEVKS
jgi:hypothetical protein